MEKSERRSWAKHKQYIKWPLKISVRTNGTQEFFSDAFFVTTQNCKKSFAAMILDVRLPNDIDVKISMPISVFFFFFTFTVIHLCDHYFSWRRDNWIWILLSQLIECFRESNVCQNQPVVNVSCELPFKAQAYCAMAVIDVFISLMKEFSLKWFWCPWFTHDSLWSVKQLPNYKFPM